MMIENRIANAVIEFLNDRKGFHVDELDRDVQAEFKEELRECIKGAFIKKP